MTAAGKWVYKEGAEYPGMEVLDNSAKEKDNIDVRVEYPEMKVVDKMHAKIAERSPDLDMISELPEQIMAVRHLSSNDVVLELGANVGRNSVIISSLLNDPTNQHLAIETDPETVKELTLVRDQNNTSFRIHSGAISNTRMCFKEWKSMKLSGEEGVPDGWTETNTTPWEQVKHTFAKPFNAIVADCEGCFTGLLKENPDMLSGVSKILLEHDFNNEEDLEFFRQHVNSFGFKLTDYLTKEDLLCPGKEWEDGVLSDPIFVSFWTRE